ncbi:hypothetical protein KC685_00790 [Candidatus Dojkabacteria bacterium]|uniref:AlgX/AlgJ SGNH hydrolase-like domain-containing protein n=1 Tax=Candidatus Dojkabacteria bacterium TaxID=2099670 RepID=A0A955I0H9_9BACT|nr:hypothetical protein [Candidatus Dojkabacteria bacterium]
MILCTPSLIDILGVKTFDGNSEKRTLAEFPEMPTSIASLEEYTSLIDAYIKDNFGLRDLLVKIDYQISYDIFGVAGNEKVIVGKDNWLFLDEIVGVSTIDYYKNKSPFTNLELDQWQLVLESRANWLKRRGIQYYFFVAPNKHSLYPEFIPDSILQVSDVSRYDQLYAQLDRSEILQTIDVKQILLDSKEEYPLYYRSGTHWNSYGAFIGYMSILDKITEELPELSVVEIEDYSVETRTEKGSDLAQLINLQDSITEESPMISTNIPRTYELENEYTDEDGRVISHYVNPNGEPLKILMLGDSFMNALKPYFAQSFSEATFCSSSSTNFPVQYIEEYEPDIVIQEIVERRIGVEDPFNPVIMEVMK